MAGIAKLNQQKGKIAAKKTAVKNAPAIEPAKIVLLIGGKPRKKTVAPKNIAVAADTLYLLRSQRLAVQKVVDELAKEEGIQREYIIENLPKSKASGITGRVAHASIDKKAIWRPVDWEKVYAYISKNKRFDLLEKRLSSSAMNEMAADKKAVPGTEKFEILTVSCTKK